MYARGARNAQNNMDILFLQKRLATPTTLAHRGSMPLPARALICSTTDSSLALRISGRLNAAIALYCCSEYIRKARPGPVRPARPLRCSALARLIQPSCAACWYQLC